MNIARTAPANCLCCAAFTAAADTLRIDAVSPGATPGGPARWFILSTASCEEEKPVAAPRKIVPREDKLAVPAAAFAIELPPWSLNVLRVPMLAKQRDIR